jgi:hypothetical protein
VFLGVCVYMYCGCGCAVCYSCSCECILQDHTIIWMREVRETFKYTYFYLCSHNDCPDKAARAKEKRLHLSHFHYRVWHAQNLLSASNSSLFHSSAQTHTRTCTHSHTYTNTYTHVYSHTHAKHRCDRSSPTQGTLHILP